jgi:DNA-binding transcriptional regulator LsrR (DeoR family)
MSVKIITQLLKQHDLNPNKIAISIGVNRSLVYRTIDCATSGGSRRVRIFISKSVGFPPSKLFTNLSKDVLSIDDHLFYQSLIDDHSSSNGVSV